MKTLYLALFSLCAMTPIFGQKGLVKKEVSKNGNVSFARFRQDSVPDNQESIQRVFKGVFEMTNDDELRFQKTKRDKYGYDHYYYQQYFKDVRVETGVYSVHAKNNFTQNINGTFHTIKGVSIEQIVSESDALKLALQDIGATKYAWDVTLGKDLNNARGYSYPKGESVIMRGVLKHVDEYRLAWKFNIYAVNPLSRNFIYVDAQSGEIIAKFSGLHSANATGSAATRYSGTRTITTDSNGGGYRLRETRNSVQIQTYNMLGQVDNFGSHIDFTDANNSWTSLEYHNGDKDDAALDAHWGAEMVLDYWNTVHSRNSLDDAGMALINYVHVDFHAINSSLNNDNATWDGASMLYGDGITSFSPTTALDVCAHETGHGICENTVNLLYAGESGAINESFSDIWGACVENWATVNKQTWTIAEDITIVSPYLLRAMSSPSAGLTAQPDTYEGTNWHSTASPNLSNDFGGVHTNSGVMNFWFYLVSVGGYGTNDNSNFYSVTGIGIESAARIAYQTESFELPQPGTSSNTELTFEDLRTETITAATRIFCENSKEVIAVTNAWFAVGVGAAYSGSTFSVTGPALICSSETYSESGQPSGVTSLTWSTSYVSGLTINSSGVASRVSSYDGNVNVKATIVGTAGCTTTSSVQVRVGKPEIIVGNWPQVQCSSAEEHNVTSPPSGTTIQWGTWGALYIIGSTTGVHANIASNGEYLEDGYVYVTFTNSCGYTTYNGDDYVPCQDFFLRVSPNPASNELTVSFGSKDGSKSIRETEINLFNDRQEKVFSTVNTESKIQINTKSFPKGAYILQVIRNNKKEETRVIFD